MSKIYSKDTRTEFLVRRRLFAIGIRYRKHDVNLPGKPDIVVTKYKTVVFVHGCFWHGHQGCKASKLPETRRDFWENKIMDNIKRDKRDIAELRNNGWKVIVVWQCEINSNKKREERLEEIISEIKGNSREISGCQERLKVGQSLYS